MKEENLGIGNTIRLKIGGKENLRGKNGIKCRGRAESSTESLQGRGIGTRSLEWRRRTRKKEKRDWRRKGGIERVRVKLADVITRIEMSEEL